MTLYTLLIEPFIEYVENLRKARNMAEFWSADAQLCGQQESSECP